MPRTLTAVGRGTVAGLAIVLLAAGAAVSYGVLNDQVTAEFSPQYFTIGHIDHLHVGRPFLLAFEWGFLGTWWVGLTLGVPAALIARLGFGRKLTTNQFAGPLVLVLGIMALAALSAGTISYFVASAGLVRISDVVRPGVAADQRLRYYADWWANIGAYAAGGSGGLALLAWGGWRRLHPVDQGPPAAWLLWVRRFLVAVGAVSLLLATSLIASGRMP